MKRYIRKAVLGVLGTALVVPALVVTPAQAGPVPGQAEVVENYDVLVVGKTTGFRHSSIDEATTAIIALGEANGFSVDVWDPPTSSRNQGQPDRTLPSTPFTSASDLGKYETIVFVSTVDGTNNLDPAKPTLLDAGELTAFQGYIRAGGGFAGVHAATDSMHTVPWYSQLTGGGARFVSHPEQQNAVQVVEDGTHPSTEHLSGTWTRFDEWYNFTQSPRNSVRVLTNLDETTYNARGNAMGSDHPLSWCQNFESSRSWYTGGGHTEASYVEPAFLKHLLGGITWSAGAVSGGGDCVTWAEVGSTTGDLLAEGKISSKAATQLTKQLDKAQDLAEAGLHADSADKLNAAAAQVRAHIDSDSEAYDLLLGKVRDLQTWQLGLE
ncbi:type 1 glutamine amidotransferase [Arthrobacter sp. V1I9]|uniref:ThuA domain-containing protein n=1 Tax=Arthrobacter sp. V1I9 TaxID=3042275 RepID=UPI00278DA4BC|nr:ThuA domain-containing protein [Arthrobacter sp. V1I9]MDQ0871140.1 type 1 glutamine amidotransferase [Arthrobacter sp. V1I9]